MSSTTQADVAQSFATRQREEVCKLREANEQRLRVIQTGFEIVHPDPETVFEIRALGVRSGKRKPYTAAGYFRDRGKAAQAALDYDRQGTTGVYVTLNAVSTALLARSPDRMTDYLEQTTTDKEVTRRANLLIDIDPARPSGVAATDAEKDVALALAHDVETALRQHGFPDPIIEDSGNGFYLIFRTGLENTDEITSLVKRFLAGLNSPKIAGMYDPAKPHAKVDQSVYNAARIIRISGTTNRKGYDTPDRPHRTAELFPPIVELGIVTRELVERIAALAPEPDKPDRGTKSDSPKSNMPRIDVARYLADKGFKCNPKVENGRTMFILDRCIFDENHGSRNEASIIQNSRGLTTYHCMHDSCQARRWQDVVQTLGPLEGQHFDPPKRNQTKASGGSSEGSAGEGQTEADAEPPRFTELLTSAEFAKADFRREFLIRGVMVAGQPGVVGGRSKALKTTIAADMVVSLGTGTPFLGKFPTKKCTAAFWSGESGAAVIQETAGRIAAGRGIDLAECSVFWGFSLPKLSQADHLEALMHVIQEHGIEVLFVDPLYLSLLSAEDAGRGSDLFFMGSRLQAVGELATDLGITFYVLHHFRKTGQTDPSEPVGLEELSQSGVGEWARQWCLLDRRAPYQHDGQHELWMRVGGSAGHAGLWALTIDEGILDLDTFSGRQWEVEIETVTNTREATRQERENRKARQQEERENEHRRRLLEALRQFPDGETVSQLRSAAGLNGNSFGTALRMLLKEGRAEACEVTKTRGKYEGFKPTGK
ncbi:MAG: AAA family ATPase [Planctomycetota bacterium]